MDERDKRLVGEQVEPGGRAKAPGRLELLQRFVNTWNHELPVGWDRLGTPVKARAWLLEKRLIEPNAHVSATDAATCRELREAIRALLLANEDENLAREATAIINRATATAWLRVEVDASRTAVLVPRSRGVAGALVELLGILHDAQIMGSWQRLKACRRCGYAFFDYSKNRSAVWCAMSICGNRTKNRAYQLRRRRTPTP